MVGEVETQDARPSSFRIYMSGIISSTIYISCGCISAWTSPTFPLLRKNHVLTPSEEPWVGSLFNFGAAFGPIIIGIFNDRIGRKRTIYFLATFIFVSWLILSSSQNFYSICIGRIVGGVGLGGSFAGIAIFVSEISDVKRRGSMGSFLKTFLAMGSIIEYCIGPYVSYLALILISWSMIVLFMFLFYFLPESPVYLILAGHKESAVDSLCWYRGDLKPEEVKNELKEIENSILKSSKKKFWPTIKILLTKRGPMKGFSISLFILALQQLSAFGPIMAYTQDIFAKTQMKLAPEFASMTVGVTQLVASFPLPFLVRIFGLKPVLVVGCFGSGISVGFLSFYFYLVDRHYEIVSKLDFLPLISLLSYIIFFCNGLGPLAWAVTSEMFLPEIKSVAMALCGVLSYLIGFAIMQVFADVTDLIGIWGFFCLVSAIVISGGVGVLLFIPNTKGMTMSEIQDSLNYSKSNDQH